MTDPNDNLKRLLLAIHVVMRDRRAVTAIQALVALDTLLTLYLFAQDFFGWWSSPLPPSADAALVGLMAAMSLTLCGFLALVASLFFVFAGRSPLRTPRLPSRTFRVVLMPALYGFPALWGYAYVSDRSPSLWGGMAVSFAVVYHAGAIALLTAERIADLRSGRSTTQATSRPATGTAKTAHGRRARHSVRNSLWRLWWRLTHRNYLRQMSALDRSLYVAVWRGNAINVASFLERGANPNLRLVYDGPLLSFAVGRSNPEIVRLLLDAGADTEAFSPIMGTTPLIAAATGNHTETATLLLKHGALVDGCSRTGVTALAIAARRGNSEMVRLLLSFGASVNSCSRNGTTALMVAASAGHVEVVRLLMDAGADAKMKNPKGVDALRFARRKNHLDVIALLESSER